MSSSYVYHELGGLNRLLCMGERHVREEGGTDNREGASESRRQDTLENLGALPTVRLTDCIFVWRPLYFFSNLPNHDQEPDTSYHLGNGRPHHVSLLSHQPVKIVTLSRYRRRFTRTTAHADLDGSRLLKSVRA